MWAKAHMYNLQGISTTKIDSHYRSRYIFDDLMKHATQNEDKCEYKPRFTPL